MTQREDAIEIIHEVPAVLELCCMVAVASLTTWVTARYGGTLATDLDAARGLIDVGHQRSPTRSNPATVAAVLLSAVECSNRYSARSITFGQTRPSITSAWSPITA